MPYAVAGSKIFIGGVLADKSTDFVESDFAGQVWTEIKGWTNWSGFGDASQTITTPIISEARDKKQKGTRNAGSMENTFTTIEGDAGQAALIAAEKTSDNYAFRVDLKRSGGQFAKRYFIGLVTTAREPGGDANATQNIVATTEINSNIVPVAAA